MNVRRIAAILMLGAGLASQSGCAVPQPHGEGSVTRRIEPQTHAAYWLYLPQDYVANQGKRTDRRGWPLVVTFHGMRPWDDCGPQIREWQQEADRYGFIVVAPELRTCDSFMQYPLKDPDLPYVQRDERATLAIMDEVFRETSADPSRVLATSWSSGGYIAHFMVNRHPERFSCLAVRQSNFSESMLSPAQVSKYRDMRVGIFFGENDFKVCREESKRAVEWYRQYRFPVQAKYVSGLGHERTPQTAAAFFASSVGATPKTPPDLGQMVMYDIPTDDVRSMPRRPDRRANPAQSGSSTAPSVATAGTYNRDSNLMFNTPGAEPALPKREPVRVTPTDTTVRAPSQTRVPPADVPTPRRPIRQPYTAEPPAPRTERQGGPVMPPLRERNEPPPIPARIQLDGEKVGPAPLMLNFGIEMPDDLRDGASILWMDNDQPITNSFKAQRLFKAPGRHTIEARITTGDDRQITLRETVTVLADPTTRPAS